MKAAQNPLSSAAAAPVLQATPFNVLPWGYLQVDEGDRVTFWNQWLEIHTGLLSAAVIGRRLGELYPDRPNIASSLLRARGASQPQILSQAFHRNFLPVSLPEGHMSGFREMQQETLVVPLPEPAGHLAVIIRDVTSVVVGQQRMRTLQNELSEARDAALESANIKSQFLAVMSHEIRTPLNAICGFSEILRDMTADPEAREYVDLVLSSSQHLLQLINDLLDFSKIEAKGIELESLPVDLELLANEALELTRKDLAAKGLSSSVVVEGPPPGALRGDPTRIRQVLVNLVSNGVKFTERGGIHIRFSHGLPDRGEVEVRASVQDSGIGIDPERQARIFNPFTQADMSTTRKYGGTGLGLSICKKLVALMGGRLWVESAPGNGSTFLFTLKLRVEG